MMLERHLVQLLVLGSLQWAGSLAGAPPSSSVAPPPPCSQWSARPCWASSDEVDHLQLLDCAFRNVTRDFAGKLLEPFGRAARSELEDALQLERYCPELRRTSRPPPGRAQDASAIPCRFSGGAPNRAVYYVAATGGDDTGVGSGGAPFATVERALAASRSRVRRVGATIVLLPGTHYLTNGTIELDGRDSGLVVTGCDGSGDDDIALPTILSAGIALNQPAAWEAVPGEPHISMLKGAFQGHAIDGLFLSSTSSNVRLVRARHPNSNPERVIWPTGPQAANGQFSAEQYIGPEQIRYPQNWLDPPAWQLEAPRVIEVNSPNWNGASGGLPSGVNFTSSGGMSPYYQARVGGPMNRFVGGINPGACE